MNIRTLVLVGLIAAAAALAGCTGPNPFVRVDLDRNLSHETLQRYEKEWQNLQAAGHAEGPAMIESSNWWPLGLLAYHRDSSVMRIPGPDGPAYTVMSGTGFGPLSILYAGSTHATFNANGERVNLMKMGNYLWMHLAMTHESDTKLPDGRRERMTTLALLMHAINIQKTGGHTYVSILTLPNAIGATVQGGHAEH